MQITEALERFLLQLQADGRSQHTVLQYNRHVRKLAIWAARVGHSRVIEEILSALARRPRSLGRSPRLNLGEVQVNGAPAHPHRLGHVLDGKFAMAQYAREFVDRVQECIPGTRLAGNDHVSAFPCFSDSHSL